ncbi:MAG: hypothetical protein ABW167_20025 [Baekduia sp.]
MRRQRCAWCGALIQGYDLSRIARPTEPGEDPDVAWEPAIWDGLVAVDGGAFWSVVDPEDGKIPPTSCMALEDHVTA